LSAGIRLFRTFQPPLRSFLLRPGAVLIGMPDRVIQPIHLGAIYGTIRFTDAIATG